MRVKFLALENNAMALARTRAQTAQSRDRSLIIRLLHLHTSILLVAISQYKRMQGLMCPMALQDS